MLFVCSMVPFLLPVVESIESPPAETRPAEERVAPKLDAVTAPRRPHDAMFPGHGHVSTTVSSGFPFVAMGELAVGIGDRVALGAVGGTTPDMPVFGARPRVAIFDTGHVRGVLDTWLYYYPSTRDGGSAWVLTRPAFVVQYAWDSGVRLGAGAGVIAASSLAELRGERVRSTYGSTELSAGVFETAHVTLAVPISEQTSLHVDGALVFHDFEVAGDEWIGVFPFLASAGITTNIL